MAKVRTGAITTHVQRLPAAGGDPDAPLVVFVHGLLTDSLASYYFTVGPQVAAAGVDVLMYDLRGHGRSDRPATGYRLEHFVQDLVLLLDALGETRPVHVVGNSFGGTVATALAAWHPDLVATVTMIEGEPPVAGWTGRMRDALTRARANMVSPEALDWIEATYGRHTAKLARGAARILESTTVAEDVPLSRVIDDDLSALTRPLLAVFGDVSGLCRQVPGLAASVPGCRTVVLADQDHSVLVERPHETRDLLLDWVRAHHAVASR
ncbi:alpha/beta hydrolase [Actinosynnema sp. NPDC047251]|uniref:Alpha/beta hydrolase fold containing protein n=1 Tax=Saccharothrix espanaensis (strain ATCC 51144 / DSM 44229 / JCM 9112 / NBRC 15066 / NRRL 15764) TaxID=1179773 RepID=K0K5N1_SACES|nr:alpha/beta hydrolase [Saccharothrix espanaensis]CCH31868.1 alpha/beta hydrolase fold containing protein [Saccharothrix espanaensis DSM 44229]